MRWFHLKSQSLRHCWPSRGKCYSQALHRYCFPTTQCSADTAALDLCLSYRSDRPLQKVCLPFHFRQIETPFSAQIKLFQLRHCNLDYCKGCQWPISDICFNSTELVQLLEFSTASYIVWLLTDVLLSDHLQVSSLSVQLPFLFHFKTFLKVYFSSGEWTVCLSVPLAQLMPFLFLNHKAVSSFVFFLN